MCLYRRDDGFNNGLSPILNITDRTKGTCSWLAFNFIVSPRRGARARCFFSVLSTSYFFLPRPRVRRLSLVLFCFLFHIFPVSLDFLSCRFAVCAVFVLPSSRSLFPYFILASPREKLYTSPSHFSCLPSLLLPIAGHSYVSVLHCSASDDEDLLAAFRSFHGRDARLARRKPCPKTTRLLPRGVFTFLCETYGQ